MNSRPAIPEKYRMVNGVRELTPEYKKWKEEKGNQSRLPAPQHQPLPVESTVEDVLKAGGKLAPSTLASLEIMDDYVSKFESPSELNGENVLDGISAVFAEHEIPIGLLNKLTLLTEYKLNFIIDDSGSMTTASDIQFGTCHPFMRESIKKSKPGRENSSLLDRWEEVEDRLHVMIDLLAYVPTNPTKIRFLNHRDEHHKIVLSHKGKTPEQFAKESHGKIRNMFSSFRPGGGTPLGTIMAESFSEVHAATKYAEEKQTPSYSEEKEDSESGLDTIHFILTDGVPNDVSIEGMKALTLTRNDPVMSKWSIEKIKAILKYCPEILKNEPDPEVITCEERDKILSESDRQLIINTCRMQPVNYISCGNEDDTKWMKIVEELVPYTSEVDDFRSEEAEVREKQGEGFAFPRGVWLLCNLVAPLCPTDLDAIDESYPFTRLTMSNLHGRILSTADFKHYFDLNPNARKYRNAFDQFNRDDVEAQDVIKQLNKEKKSSFLTNISSRFNFGNKKDPKSSSLDNTSAPPPYSPGI